MSDSTIPVWHEPSLFIGVGTQTKTKSQLSNEPSSQPEGVQSSGFLSYTATVSLEASKAVARPTKPLPTIPIFIK